MPPRLKREKRLINKRYFFRILIVVLFAVGRGPSSLYGQGGQVTYLYDALGRLVGVVDPNGASATYVYDAVGNLLSIQRHNPGSVSIAAFSPASGAPGASVTVSGTGFSTTPTQNTLQFNGVTANVTSSTATHLVATVPSGVTAGALTVTTPTGSATSNQPFVVTTGAPTITSVSPAAAVVGTSTVINGLNFESSPGQ